MGVIPDELKTFLVPDGLRMSDWPGAEKMAKAVEGAVQAQSQAGPQVTPRLNMNFKDVPPPIQVQMEQKAGMQPVDPSQYPPPQQPVGAPR
jgi:hypothetical protein